MADGHRKKSEDALLLALACGATVEDAARLCGLSDRTVYRRLQDPDFQTRLRQLRTDMVRQAAGLLTAAAGEAVKTLTALQQASAPPAVRLGAARSVLELGFKFRELAELEADVRALEEKVGAMGLLDDDCGRRATRRNG